MENTDVEFETAAADLEKSIEAGQAPGVEETSEEKFMKGIKSLVTDLQKGKGGQPTDLKADKDKRGSLVEDGKDPAEKPVPSGKGYKDSAHYEARKGHKASSSGKASSTGKESSSGAPDFFKKKKKKMKKASSSAVDETEEDTADATEFMEGMEDAVMSLHKSVARLEEGLACFGELLTDMADPRKEKLNLTVAKALSHVLSEQREIKKALGSHNTLMKAIAQMPGAPKVAGLAAISAAGGAGIEDNTDVEGETPRLTKSQRNGLFQLRVNGKIDEEQRKEAINKGPKAVDDLISSFKKA